VWRVAASLREDAWTSREGVRGAQCHGTHRRGQ
jgi:hypothetical protein